VATARHHGAPHRHGRHHAPPPTLGAHHHRSHAARAATRTGRRHAELCQKVGSGRHAKVTCR
jgi:hypothetical protein